MSSSASKITYLAKLLRVLTPEELKSLRSALGNAEKRESLIQFLETWSDESWKSQIRTPAEIPFASQPTEEFIPAHEDRRAFYILLGDRETLPSTKEVARVISLALGLKIPTKTNSKISRELLINRAWQTFERLPRAEQMGAMNRLIENLPSSSNSEYQRLFKFLTRHER